jgi:Concanavalin A-like lectin/glucanases superfamily
MTYTDDGDDEMTVYINGVNKGSSTLGDGAPATGDTNDLLIGGPNQAHFKGFIDEFKVYSYERTGTQLASDVGAVSSLHGKSASVGTDDSFLSDGLVGYWKMDDGVGNPCSAGVDKACDSSGNGNTGTWTNGVASTSGKFGFATNYDGVDDYIDIPYVSSLAPAQFTVTAWYNSGSSPSLRPSPKACHSWLRCAFAYCVHFVDHTPSAGSA